MINRGKRSFIGWANSALRGWQQLRDFRSSLLCGNHRSPSAENVHQLLSILDSDPNAVVSVDDSKSDNVSDSDSRSILEDHNTDWRKQYKGQSKVLLRPRSTEQVSRVLQYCHSQRLPVVPQGGKTGLCGGAVPVSNEIILSMDRMNQIFGVCDTGILYCQTGCILADLQDYASARDLLVPIDLGAKGTCQIGGNLSTNAGGQYYFRYGSVAANLVGLQAVLPNEKGQILNLNFSPNNTHLNQELNEPVAYHSNLKDNTGYKLHQLMVGAEGTLGVVTAMALKCHPLPRSRKAAFLACHSFDQVAKLIQLAKKELGEILAAMEWMDQSALKTVQSYSNVGGVQARIPVTMNNDGSTPYAHSILLETHGSCEEHDSEKLDSFLRKAMHEQGNHGILVEDGAIAQDLTQVAEYWSIREMANPAFSSLGYGYKYDLSLPVATFSLFGDRIRHQLEQQNLEHTVCASWGHVLDGNIHLNICTPGNFQLDEEVLGCLEPFVFEETLKQGGSISAEHGIGQSKRGELLRVQYCCNRDNASP